MFTYIVLFEDDEAFAAERQHNMKAHLSFLAAHADQISAAGPLMDSVVDSGAGGLWLVQAPSSEAVEALIHADPFWPTGLRKSHRILQWRQVFRDGKKLI
ncbi:YciI family protein [Candidatus Puniceispirillum marinum]|uniref:YCII-related domain protein n=1 Tax=Puniceispirillum marinum (strain IMCC1322) TaxID=488538 RepID=D5BP43_PUNMI|nr:YciI family protein [Candidatus Puniceispirillum marinum]ADE40477.1 YCII-related domain protein [Candidatus Puniceispirillum marinum IMCC1322]